MSCSEPLDAEFVANYSTNDLFLQNRLILPEEVPLLALPLLRHVLRGGYRRVVFIERGAQPWLWAATELLRIAGNVEVELSSLRVKALVRESVAVNLLTVAVETPGELTWLTEEPSVKERRVLQKLLPRDAELISSDMNSTLSGTRTHLITRFADAGLDPRAQIPGALKAAVFLVGNLMLQGPVSARGIRKTFRERHGEFPPVALSAVDTMLAQVTETSGQVTLPALLDAMNGALARLRGTLEHSTRPLLNALLGQTATGRRWFAGTKTLFVDELSVCGGSCFALEIIGRAFQPDFRPCFASVVEMTAHRTFLDATVASFFELKPPEDVPWLSPDRFMPIYTDGVCQPMRVHRFPSCRAVGPRPAWWRREAWSNDQTRMAVESSAEADCQQWEQGLKAWLERKLLREQLAVVWRRSGSAPDLLPALLAYYFGCLQPREGMLYFKHDTLLEARLESVLSFCGRLQKPFFGEMDRLFSWLVERETARNEPLRRLRQEFFRHRPAIEARIVRDVRQQRQRFEQRMEGGLEAVRAHWPAVENYLGAGGRGAGIRSEFGVLRERLQRAVP